ncbi:MarR family winged helix-turn-helix transcriptional regulator [Deinococcus roseus]|uniref:MarR family transcriptional regulator n=1 Tax=Deinococcus roseus TaxID=392414 RepID=A0ABQ2D5R8_9DEIO|nr:MarR family transcriptional regulator [Deinococcus roseus]GGJ46485.1 MarR family transcriptional regulator [Deinococcus roseus]
MTVEDQHSLGRAIVQMARTHKYAAQLLLQKLGLHPGQDFLLLLLDRVGETRLTTLSEHLEVQPPTASKMVARLEKEGFLERIPDPTDTRATLICLSPAGKALIPQIVEVWDELEKLTVQGLSQAEIMLLNRMFKQITQNLGEPPGGFC